MAKYFIIFCCTIICLAAIIGVFGIKYFKESEPYRAAVNDAFNNPRIQVETGKVTGVGFMVAGEISNTNADLTFTVEGEDKDLKVYYKLSKSSQGIWTVTDLSW